MLINANMNQKQQFNAELYFANPQSWTLETRDGIKDITISKRERDEEQFDCYPIRVKTSDNRAWTVTSSGGFYKINAANELDIFMIPIQPLTTDIPFTIEDFKTGKYDVRFWNSNEIPLFFRYNEHLKVFDIVWEFGGSTRYTLNECINHLRLIEKPITPFTHPELYEVSNDKIDWYDVIKYYDNSNHKRDKTFSHVAYTEYSGADTYKFLRLKDQPTIITQQQADEAIKKIYPNYKIED